MKLFGGLNAGLGTVSATAVQPGFEIKMHFAERLQGDCTVKMLIILLFTSYKCLWS